MECPICQADVDPWTRVCRSCSAVRSAQGHWTARGPRGRRVGPDGAPARLPRGAVRVLVTASFAVAAWGCVSSAGYTAERQDHDQVISAREACHGFVVDQPGVPSTVRFEPLAASTADEVDGEYVITGTFTTDAPTGTGRAHDYRCVVSDAGSHWRLDALTGVR